MDKNEALKISKGYLKKIKDSNISFFEAWLFGSFAKGKQNENSDIDLAIILDGEDKSFDTEVQLMVLRDGKETLIEPHAFTKIEFDPMFPIINQIVTHGERIEI
jgi:predicted nucleotidyltransferase